MIDAQTIYRKVEMPADYEKGSLAKSLAGKSYEVLTSKAKAYMTARSNYLAALDAGAGNRWGVVNILKAEKEANQKYSDYARTLRQSGLPDEAKAGTSAIVNDCSPRLATIETMLAGLEN